eukprot:8998760-Alexandrium_andersonii.AAC.1
MPTTSAWPQSDGYSLSSRHFCTKEHKPFRAEDCVHFINAIGIPVGPPFRPPLEAERATLSSSW